MDELANRVALVTGAGRGIGREIARLLAGRGAHVVAASRTKGEVESLLEAVGDRITPAICDVRQKADIIALLEQVNQKFGRLDLLVNNAGIAHYLPMERTTDEVFDDMVATNLRGPFILCREAFPLLRKSGNGLVINIGSIASVQGFANFAGYCATKAGLAGFTRALRTEWRPHGIRVSLVMAGGTDSTIWDAIEGQWDRSKMIRASDVAEAVVAIARQPGHMTTEEILIMPSGGALSA